MAGTFRCTLVTPVAQVLDQEVSSVVLPAHDGQMGVLHLHAPMMVQLGTGTLKITPAGGGERKLTIKGGFAQIKDDKLVVLTDEAGEDAA